MRGEVTPTGVSTGEERRGGVEFRGLASSNGGPGDHPRVYGRNRAAEGCGVAAACKGSEQGLYSARVRCPPQAAGEFSAASAVGWSSASFCFAGALAARRRIPFKKVGGFFLPPDVGISCR